MATIMRFHGEDTNALVDLSMIMSGASDTETTQFLPAPLVKTAVYDKDDEGTVKSVTMYFEERDQDRGQCWYVVFTMEDIITMKSLLNL